MPRRQIPYIIQMPEVGGQKLELKDLSFQQILSNQTSDIRLPNMYAALASLGVINLLYVRQIDFRR
ncbi:hypothetical protein [Biomaibacter acetigenes]|uniref:hypothetical protein n=1 Tax=Biomaibacter acetigenes TaxID=2316383 RepID=UPI0011C357D1|nr:hypothetical protein [Biomaibacter acetigenes]